MSLESVQWYEQPWSKGILLGLMLDPYSGYRASVWFEYTRTLINEIREGSLIAVRNFSDRSRLPNGAPDPSRTRSPSFEEYSILQIDVAHPWHYAMQGAGEGAFPGFSVASAESAREDWTAMDTNNQDDVSRIKCEAIPLRLAFRVSDQDDWEECQIKEGEEIHTANLPKVFYDRSKPMLGYEAHLLTPDMTERIINKGLEEPCVYLGTHVAQHEVDVQVKVDELLRLHFGIFGYTGVGKSNLMSTLVRKILTPEHIEAPADHCVVDRPFRIVLFDLMDEYTGLLVDQLVHHPNSKVVVAGRHTLPDKIVDGCRRVAKGGADAERAAKDAAEDWAKHIVLPRDLTKDRDSFVAPLFRLISDKRLLFYESAREQGEEFDLSTALLLNPQKWGEQAYGKTKFYEATGKMRSELDKLLEKTKKLHEDQRDKVLYQIIEMIEAEKSKVATGKARGAIDEAVSLVKEYLYSRSPLEAGMQIDPNEVARELNDSSAQGSFEPSLTIVIGENEYRIAEFARWLIDKTFKLRRENSTLEPTISFIFDEADVFIGSTKKEGETESPANVKPQATLLARRGRKFGLGLGIATQRALYLDTSIMAQPHTYFISKLPRKTDRQRVAEAFAISDVTLEQTFDFTPGQWLITSHDATGMKGTPFPVAVENANDRVKEWLDQYSS